MSERPAAAGERGRRVARQALLAVASRGAGVVLLIVLTPYLVSRLGADGYGVWVLVTAATGLMGALDLGVAPGMSRLVAHAVARGDRNAVRGLVSDGLALTVALVAVLALAAAALVPTVVDGLGLRPALRDDARTAIRLAVAVFAVATAGGVLEGAMIGLGRIGRVAALRFASVAAFAVAAVLVLESGGGVASLAAAQLAVTCATLVVAAAVARATYGASLLRRPSLRGRRVRELLAFSLPRQASRTWLIGAQHYERYVVGLALGATAAGAYGVASVLAGGLAVLLAQATLPLIPALTSIAVADGEERAGFAYRRVTGGLAIASAGAFGALGAVAQPLLAAWAGPEVGTQPRYLQLLAAGFFAWTLASVGFTAAQALGRPRLEAQAAIAGLAATLLAAPLVIAVLSEDGVAIGTAVGLVLGTAVFFDRLGRHVAGVARAALAEARLPCLAALAAAVPIALANAVLLDAGAGDRAGLGLLAAGEALLFAAAYGVALVACGRLRREDLRTAARILREPRARGGRGSRASRPGSASDPGPRTGTRHRPGSAPHPPRGRGS